MFEFEGFWPLLIGVDGFVADVGVLWFFLIELFQSRHLLDWSGKLSVVVVHRIGEVDMNVEDDGKESTSRDSRRGYEVVGQRALLTKQWKQGSFFLEQRLWGCSHIRSGLGWLEMVWPAFQK